MLHVAFVWTMYGVSSHSEADTKWLPFFRKHIQMYLFDWKCINFNNNFNEVCSLESNYEYSHTSIGSVNGLVLTRRHDDIWTNSCISCRRLYASLVHNGLGVSRQNNQLSPHVILYTLPHLTLICDYVCWWVMLNCACSQRRCRYMLRNMGVRMMLQLACQSMLELRSGCSLVPLHYSDTIMGEMASQITSLTIGDGNVIRT